MKSALPGLDLRLFCMDGGLEFDAINNSMNPMSDSKTANSQNKCSLWSVAASNDHP
jgi:hypothetical protein